MRYLKIDEALYTSAKARNYMTPWLAISQSWYEEQCRAARDAVKMAARGRRLSKRERETLSDYESLLLVHYNKLNKHFSEVSVYHADRKEELSFGEKSLKERDNINQILFSLLDEMFKKQECDNE